MLVLLRLYPKGGLNSFWNVLESEKRNLYWEDVKPIYAIQQEGKDYISVTLDVKNIASVDKIYVKNLSTMASVKKTRTIRSRRAHGRIISAKAIALLNSIRLWSAAKCSSSACLGLTALSITLTTCHKSRWTRLPALLN